MYSSEQFHEDNEARRTPAGSTSRTRRERDEEGCTARMSHCRHVREIASGTRRNALAPLL